MSEQCDVTNHKNYLNLVRYLVQGREVSRDRKRVDHWWPVVLSMLLQLLKVADGYGGAGRHKGDGVRHYEATVLVKNRLTPRICCCNAKWNPRSQPFIYTTAVPVLYVVFRYFCSGNRNVSMGWNLVWLLPSFLSPPFRHHASVCFPHHLISRREAREPLTRYLISRKCFANRCIPHSIPPFHPHYYCNET